MPVSEVKRISVLSPVYGSEVELIGEDNQPEPYRIVAEFALGDRLYAGLQTAAMRKDDEIAFFRIAQGENPGLETIDDEDEWEAAAEAYDDLVFIGDERP